MRIGRQYTLDAYVCITDLTTPIQMKCLPVTNLDGSYTLVNCCSTYSCKYDGVANICLFKALLSIQKAMTFGLKACPNPNPAPALKK